MNEPPAFPVEMEDEYWLFLSQMLLLTRFSSGYFMITRYQMGLFFFPFGTHGF